MFKAAIFRQARLCPASGPPRAILTSLKPAFRTTRTLQTGRWVRVMPPIPRLLAGRGYSSAAAPNATVEQSSTREPGSTEDLVTRFADLPSLGVHEHLVRSLTDTLGYETMTEVQSKTISPALAGKDLFVRTHPLLFVCLQFQRLTSSGSPKRRPVRARRLLSWCRSSRK